MTDGYIPASLVRQIGTPVAAARLVAAGLWTTVDEPCGYLMHDWNEYQPTRETVRIRRENESERQRTWRANNQVNGNRHAVTNSVPTRPDPTHSEGARPRRARAKP